MKGLKEKIVEPKEEQRQLELLDYFHPWERFEPIHLVDEKAEGLYKVGVKAYLP